MNKEREKQILEIILKEKQISVKELARRTYASEPSIRRDLSELEKQSFIKRIHGGAILSENTGRTSHIPFLIRELEQSDAKIIIAQKASELVNDGNIIMTDASSTTYGLIPFLSSKSQITLITSGIKALIRADEYNINVKSTGGKLLPSCLSLTGEDAYHIISEYNADICFISCRGLSTDGWLTDFSIEENHVRQHMLKQAKIRVLLCTSQKVGKKYSHNLCHLNDIDYVITETKLPEKYKEMLRQAHKGERFAETQTVL